MYARKRNYINYIYASTTCTICSSVERVQLKRIEWKIQNEKELNGKYKKKEDIWSRLVIPTGTKGPPPQPPRAPTWGGAFVPVRGEPGLKGGGL